MSTTVETKRAFPSPFEIKTPPGCEGWEEMYPYFCLFSEDRRESDENKFWFYNGMHFPEPMPPFDCITAEAAYVALGQSNTRLFLLPPALGIDHRIVNGYVYISANPVTDPQQVAARAKAFQERAGYYYQHWDELDKKWRDKMVPLIRELEDLKVPELPEVEDISIVTSARGIGSSQDVLEAYNRCIEGLYRAWQIHFEMLLLGYGAYLTFIEFCKKAFPEISDQAVAKMVAGLDVTMFRPDDELRRLAKAAVDLGVAAAFKDGKTPQAILDELGRTEAGKRWVNELEKSRQPWFYMSTGDGFYHHHRCWNDDLRLPFSSLAKYVGSAEQGVELKRPLDAVRKERDRITAEYRTLLRTDEDRQVFDQMLGLCRTVFPHVESHKFYVEHWYSSVFFNKIRDFGRLFVKQGFFREPDDIFILHYHEIHGALLDLLLSWSTGGAARGPRYWPPIIARRKRILERLKEWTPPPALGPVPEEILDPTVRLLWGITGEQLREWYASLSGPIEQAVRELHGAAASPGVAEGVARVVRAVEQLGSVKDGEILVCTVTAPSWAPIFGKIKAAVSDIGGIMSHAAIVAREYGMPAVTGTGLATRTIRTGQRIRVDGNRGEVTILD